jgi:hypothetical protein
MTVLTMVTVITQCMHSVTSYFITKWSHVMLEAILGWLITCSPVLMNSDSFSFLIILLSSLYMISVLFLHILWSSSQECSAVFDSDISPILMFHLCFMVLCIRFLSYSFVFYSLHPNSVLLSLIQTFLPF